MNAVTKFLSDHHEVLLAIGYFVLQSAVSTMPKTWTGVGTLWGWFYDCLHEFFSLLSQKYNTQLKAAEGQVPPAPTPIQQAEPATPPKETPSV